MRSKADETFVIFQALVLLTIVCNLILISGEGAWPI